jgi:hypothetical protein
MFAKTSIPNINCATRSNIMIWYTATMRTDMKILVIKEKSDVGVVNNLNLDGDNFSITTIVAPSISETNIITKIIKLGKI